VAAVASEVGARLIYGDREIVLADDAAAAELARDMQSALQGAGVGPWVEVKSADGQVHTVLISPGIPVHFVTS
jgi:hypothetical protein